MATGGDNLYECSICLSDMVGRNPKLLQCHHSFCTSCLEQLVQNNQIHCPTCRVRTDVPSNNVNQLTTDFHLMRMYEREQQVISQMKNVTMDMCCQMCHKQEGVNKCQDCSKRLCSACTQKHDSVSHLKGHTVLPLCKNHVEGITHVCLKCVQSVCITCILMEHDEHESEIKEYQDGIKQLKAQLDQLRQEAKEQLTASEAEKAAVQSRSEINTEILAAIKNVCKAYDDRATKAKRLEATMNEIYNRNRKAAFDSNEMTNVSCQEILTSLEGISKQTGEDMVSNFNARKQSLKNKLAKVKNRQKVEYKIAPFVMSDPGGDDIVKYWKQQCTKEHWLSDPKCILHLTNSSNADLQMKWPLQIVHAIDSSFIANTDIKQVLRFDIKGNIMAKYFPSESTSQVSGVALYDGFLYIHTLHEITKLPLSYQLGKKQAIYKPTVERIWKILVLNREKIIITDYNRGGTIYEYNPETDTTRVCVEDVKCPCYMSLVHTADGPCYVVTMCTAHSLHVYDRTWRHLATIGGYGTNDGQLMYPRATAVTAAGNILVADWSNNRICEFTLDGQFMRHLLTNKHGIKEPYGLAYTKPYLWITEGRYSSTASVKCFQIAQ